MNEPILGANGRPVSSMEQQAQMQMQALRTNLYLNLVPVVAAKRLKIEEEWMDEAVGRVESDRIAEEADKITLAALARMGIHFQGPQVGG